MKQEDPLFKVMYQRIYYTGSFYDGLRVGDATEFDLDLVLNLDVLKQALSFDWARPVKPGFVRFRLDKDIAAVVPPNHRFYPFLARILRELFNCELADKCYLDVDATKRWVESVATKALNSITKYPDGITDVKIRKSGPAFHVQVFRGREIIDIDLVPALTFTVGELGEAAKVPRPLRKDVFKFPKDVSCSQPLLLISNLTIFPQEFFAIPKTSDNILAWRLDFHDYEKRLIKNTGSNSVVKPLIKLFKVTF